MSQIRHDNGSAFGTAKHLLGYAQSNLRTTDRGRSVRNLGRGGGGVGEGEDCGKYPIDQLPITVVVSFTKH